MYTSTRHSTAFRYGVCVFGMLRGVRGRGPRNVASSGVHVYLPLNPPHGKF